MFPEFLVKVIVGLLLVQLEFGERILAGDVAVENTCQSEISGEIIGLKVEDCNGFPCTCRREKRYRVDFTFSPVKDHTLLRLKCGTNLYNQPTTLRDVNVCEHLTEGTCPFVTGENYTYTTSFKIPYWVPPTTYPVACQMVDDGGAYLFCGGGGVRLI